MSNLFQCYINSIYRIPFQVPCLLILVSKNPTFYKSKCSSTTLNIQITLMEETKGSEVPTQTPPTVSCGTTCGQDRMRKNGQKIVGGVDAGPGEIGWQVRLKRVECTL